MKANLEKGTKICSKCKRELPIEMFQRDKSKSDGFNTQCKECVSLRAKSQEGKETAKRARQKYYQTEKGKALQAKSSKNYRQTEAGKETQKRASKKWYEANKTCPDKVYREIQIDEEGRQVLKCTKCGQLLPIENFHKDNSTKTGYDTWCKDCRRESIRKRLQTEEGKEKNRLNAKKFRESEIGQQKIKEYQQSEECKQSLHKYNVSEKGRAKRREYRQREDVKAKDLEYQKRRFQDPVNRENRRQKLKEKYDNDSLHRMKHLLRGRIKDCILGYKKSMSSEKLLGCSWEEARKYLESQFQEGMSWDNYGEWQIDHIIPCSRFDFSNPIHQRICFNYRNLQPLWAKDNKEKFNKLIEGYQDLLNEIRTALNIEDVVELKEEE